MPSLAALMLDDGDFSLNHRIAVGHSKCSLRLCSFVLFSYCALGPWVTVLATLLLLRTHFRSTEWWNAASAPVLQAIAPAETVTAEVVIFLEKPARDLLLRQTTNRRPA
jgi:hypothetical protein